jgi:N-acetylglucosamine-6-phosphate deacetylase
MKQKLQTGFFSIIFFMMNYFNINAQQTVEGLHYITGNPVQVKIENGKIASVKEVKKLNDENAKTYIAPGFFDNQVNGFAGVSFAFGESDLTPKELNWRPANSGKWV